MQPSSAKPLPGWITAIQEPCKSKLPAKVFLNCKQVSDADVLYCGVTVGSVGLYQLNLQLAPDTPAGAYGERINFRILVPCLRAGLHIGR